MKLHSFIALSAAFLAAPGLSQPAPSNDPLCPFDQPNINGGDPCSVPENSDCNYGTFSWPDSEEELSALLCTCFGGSSGNSFFCAENSVPSIDPRNSNNCPANTPSSGDMCTTLSTEDCHYQNDGEVTRCTCFDGTFGCNLPQDTSDPDNHPNCPIKQPTITGGDSCDVPTSSDCNYGEFFWPGSDQINYETFCTCFSGTFVCAQPGGQPNADPSNHETCPAGMPTLGDECSTPSDQDCQYLISSDDFMKCSCFDGAFACAQPVADVASGANPTNHPECPAMEPEIGDACTNPSNRDCLYREFYFPGSNQVTYIGRCSCFDGIFQCAEQSAPSADPTNDATCPATRPMDGDSCSISVGDASCDYLSGSENVIRCGCTEDGAFDCSDSVKPSADPNNHASCPLIQPNNMDPCITPSDTDCQYGQLVCPNGDDAGYLLFFTCLDGVFAFGVTDHFCTPVFCFDGDSNVAVEDRGLTPMKDLQIGDKVHVGDDKFEPVYSFGHYDPVVEAKFLEVNTKRSSLRLTADHLVFAASRGFVSASSLQKGDSLVLGSSGDEVVVESIRTVKRKGAFAPFTPSGQIVVDDVLASSFVALEKTPVILSLAGFTISHQWLAHAFEFPHRVVCHYLTKCPNESYTSEGISKWVAAPLKATQWMLGQHSVLRNAAMVASVMVLGLFVVLETLLFQYPLAAAFGALVAMGLFRRRQSKKMKSL